MAFDLASTTRIVRAAEDQFDSVFLHFNFEDPGDELFSVIEINFTRGIRPGRSAQRRALTADAASL
jgi:hypothetical protein